MGLLQLLPLVAAVILMETEVANAFLASSFLSLLIGGSFFFGFRSTKPLRLRKLTVLLPILGGVVLSIIIGMPFFFLFPDQGFVAAFYDGMSLLTTNGTSAYEGALSDYRSVHLWRAVAGWFGGFTAITITISFLTALNSGGLQLRRSPLRFGDSDAGHLRVRLVAQTLWPLYMLITGFCCLLLMVGGIPFLDAVIVAMVTISTTGIGEAGGSTIEGAWPQLITAIFMILSMSGWDMHYARFRSGGLDKGIDIEFRVLLGLVAVGSVVFILFAGKLTPSSVWHSSFAVISSLATSGVMPHGFLEDIDNPVSSAILLFALAGIGGAVAGTGGGLKCMRLIIIYALGRSEVDRLAHPHGVTAIKYGQEKVSDGDIEAVWLLLGSFVLVFIIGSLALAIFGVHMQTAISLAFSALTLSGPLINIADPHFAGFSGLRTADYTILSVLMLIGRVEASIFLALLAKSLWRG